MIWTLAVGGDWCSPPELRNLNRADEIIYEIVDVDSRLPENAPGLICLPPGALRKQDSCDGRPMMIARRLSDGEAVTLVADTGGGVPRLNFDIEQAILSVLKEEYFDGLKPSIVMRLPFNYSKLSPWIKSLAHRVLAGRGNGKPEIPFPGAEPPYVVDWLASLAKRCGQEILGQGPFRTWPNPYRAAVIITHDVDTDWLFCNPRWMRRIFELELAYNLRGAFYCVPTYCRTRTAEQGMKFLLDRGCELGCHGYNHDAKWPLLSGQRFQDRLSEVREFATRWKLKGFRSEWLFRTPSFLEALSGVFEYDSSIPTVSGGYTSPTRNGCGTCFPYFSQGNMLEIPLTLPMDNDMKDMGVELETFWKNQVELALSIIEVGGLVNITIHPQPHQAANAETLTALESFLEVVCSQPGIWFTQPQEILAWVKREGRAS